MKADLYIRVSTDEQAEKGYSQRDQEDRLRKYCDFKKIEIRGVIYEDYSAKTFRRPAWQKLLSTLRLRKRQTNLILFTKWDRFSRNAADAFQMIKTLRNLGVEPCAIEQPLDLDIPENKIMLGIYLTAPEVENDRRSLNVRYGMRRAVKEGRWMNGAPIGYINRTAPDGKKFIEIEQPYADIMKWAFETIIQRQLHIVEVYRLAKEKGLPVCKQTFWNSIHNPVYCGKIFLRGYKEEPDSIIKGNHEPIISEKLFLEVQDVLTGKKRVRKIYTETPTLYVLRGYLVCQRCGRTLTASASKGRSMYYHYYHCVLPCKERWKAEEVNDAFAAELAKLIPRPGMSDVYAQIINDMYKKHVATNSFEVKKLSERVSELQSNINKARMKFMADDIDKNDYHSYRKECEDEITRLEATLVDLTKNKMDITSLVRRAIENLSRLNEMFLTGKTEERRRIISAIFPEKLVFDGNWFRTARMNEAVYLIFNVGAGFSGNDGQNLSNESLQKTASGSKKPEKGTFQNVKLRTAFSKMGDPLKRPIDAGFENKKSGLLFEIFEKSTSVA